MPVVAVRARPGPRGPRRQTETASAGPVPNRRSPPPPRPAGMLGFMRPRPECLRDQQIASIESVIYITGVVAMQAMNINTVLRGIFKQRDSAWAALGDLYNCTIILHSLTKRTSDTFKFPPQVERVAKGVNQFHSSPDSSLDSEICRQSEMPETWANRSTMDLERIFQPLNRLLVNLYSNCKFTLDGRSSMLLPNPVSMPLGWDTGYIRPKVTELAGYQRQIESYLVSCKFIHMVLLQDLCSGDLASASGREDGDGHGHGLHRGPRGRRAISAFYRGPDIDHMVKSLRELGRVDRSSGSGQNTAKPKNGRKKREGSSDQSASRIQDLLVSIRRGNMSTVITILSSDIDLNVLLDDDVTCVLSQAVSDNKAALASLLVLCGASPNVHHRSGSAPLHLASKNNRTAPALMLLELGAEVDIRDAKGRTPLHIACREHHLSTVLQLLAHGADPNAYDDRGITPLGYALLNPLMRHSRHAIDIALLTYGARATSRGHALSPVAEAVLRRDHTRLEIQLKLNKVEADSVTVIATTGCANEGLVRIHPLYFATLVKDSFAWDMLIRYGADVHYQTAMYDNAVGYLFLTVRSESSVLVARALVAGLDPNVADKYGSTPLHLAASSPRCDIEVANLLIRHGADCRATTANDRAQPLHNAARAGRADICGQLIDHGADVNEALSTGITPAMLAVYGGSKNVVRFLITKGADIMHHTPDFGETAMHAACRVGSVVLAMFLFEEGVPIDATYRFPATANTNNANNTNFSDDSQETRPTVDPSCCGFAPIHIAASRGHLKAVQWLITNGADPAARIGRTAARVCLSTSKNAYDYAQSGQSPAATSCPSSADLGDAATDKIDEEPDLGETPVQVARTFGHEAVAAYIEDHIERLALEALQVEA